MRADLAQYCQLVNHNDKNNGANSNCCVVWRQTKDKEKGVKKKKEKSVGPVLIVLGPAGF